MAQSHETNYPHSRRPNPTTESSLGLEIAEEAIQNTSYVSAYHPNFERELGRRQIWLGYGGRSDIAQPSNYNELMHATHNTRDSPEPSDEAINQMAIAAAEATSESNYLRSMLPKIFPIFTADDTSRLDSYAENQQWDRQPPSKNASVATALTAPNPDVAIGWKRCAFPYPSAYTFLKSHARPSAHGPDLVFPVFIIEAEGAKSNLHVARLQSLHAAAVALQGMYALRQAVGREREFLDKIQVVSFELTPELLHLSYYWMTQSQDRECGYYGRTLVAWSTLSEAGIWFRAARKCALHALDWVQSAARGWIEADMCRLQMRIEERLEMLSQSPVSILETAGESLRRKRKRSVGKAAKQEEIDWEGMGDNILIVDGA